MLDQPHISPRPRPRREKRVAPRNMWEAAAWENQLMRRSMGRVQTEREEYKDGVQRLLDGAAGEVFTVRAAGEAIGMDYEGTRRVVQKLKKSGQIELVRQQRGASGRWEKVWRLT